MNEEIKKFLEWSEESITWWKEQAKNNIPIKIPTKYGIPFIGERK